MSPSLGAAAAPAAPLAAFVAAGRVSARGAATIALTDLLAPHRRATGDAWAERIERRRFIAPSIAERIAAASVQPATGIPLLVGVLAATFLLVMVGGGAAAGGLGAAWNAWASPPIHAVIGGLVPVPWLASALLWALDAGLLAMLSVGLPYVLAFYLVIAALEDSGYLASVTVLADRVLGAVGQPGRAAIPLLVATGCNVPAIYATRVLATRRERVIAAFLVTLTPCSARSAVVIAALAPFAGPWVALAAFGVVAALTVTAGVGANALLPGRQSPLILELPPFRRPLLRSVAAKAWFRFRDFVRTATPLMLVGSFVLGLAFESGAFHVASGAIGPLVHGWLGLPAVARIALAFSFLPAQGAGAPAPPRPRRGRGRRLDGGDRRRADRAHHPDGAIAALRPCDRRVRLPPLRGDLRGPRGGARIPDRGRHERGVNRARGGGRRRPGPDRGDRLSHQPRPPRLSSATSNTAVADDQFGETSTRLARMSRVKPETANRSAKAG